MKLLYVICIFLVINICNCINILKSDNVGECFKNYENIDIIICGLYNNGPRVNMIIKKFGDIVFRGYVENTYDYYYTPDGQYIVKQYRGGILEVQHCLMLAWRQPNFSYENGDDGWCNLYSFGFCC